MFFKKTNQAFSLIELSIVLIIISFLVGGIILGASLIKSSRISGSITDLERLGTLSNTFKAKYDFFPGDMNNATIKFGTIDSRENTVYNGNADGYIGNATPIESESLGFFHHLYLSGIGMAAYTGENIASASDVVIGTHYPKSKIGNNTYFYVRSDSIGTKFKRQNRFVISSLNSDGAVDPSMAASMDRKIDDGKPLTGKVVAGTPADMSLSFNNNEIPGLNPRRTFGIISNAHASSSDTCVTQGALSSINSVQELETATYNITVTSDVCVITSSFNRKKSSYVSTIAGTPEDNCSSYPNSSTFHVASWSGGTNLGNTAIGVCASGYSGTSVSFACSDGEWASQSGECIRVYCSAVTTAASGTGYAIWAETGSNDSVSGTCATNYGGSPTRTCAADGEWGSISSACVLNTCDAVTTAVSGTGWATWVQTNAGSSVSGTCATNYTGSSTRACGSDGEWGSVSGACTEVTCAAVTTAASGTGWATWSLSSITGSVSGTCASGYSGSPTRACTNSSGSGVWGSISSACTRVTCNAITTASSSTGYATWAQGNSGETSSGTCQSGYAGSPTRACGLDGEWGSVSGACEEVTEGYQNFAYTGSSQSLVVPSGVSSVTIQVWGAEGGKGDGASAHSLGGKGGYAKGNLSVTSGSTLYVYVGGEGQDTCPSCSRIRMVGGWNGGGDGYDTNPNDAHGGGGGASDIRYSGTGLSNRKIVAGGGGGGGDETSEPGGYGGGTTGHDGYNNYYGKGGSQSAGGASSSGCATSGLGNGASNTSSNSNCSGGGGGYYGGGSGKDDGAGGGSGYTGGVTSASMSNGSRSGNGYARICWGGHFQCN